MAERIFRIVSDQLVEIPERDPTRRYRYGTVRVTGAPELAYVEFTDAEEAQRDAEEAAAEVPPPFAGLGRAIVTRAGQTIPSGELTLLGFDTVELDNAGFYLPATPDRLVIPARQGGLFAIGVEVRFDESSASAGVGDRAISVRMGPLTLHSASQRPRLTGDTEIALALERDVTPGAELRFAVFQSSPRRIRVDARVALRRVGGSF